MINITTSSHLGIILPNTNKALAQVLSNATKQELETISQGKDLKSILNTIFKRSGTDSSADKKLLQLVKNNPTLKNLGDVSATIKDLLNSIKSSKNQLPIEKTLNNFLTDIKDLKNSELKQKFENSGLFLESRLKNVKNPIVDLKTTLISLIKTLQSSPLASNIAIMNEIKLLLNSETMKIASNYLFANKEKTDTKIFQQLSASVESIISKLKTQSDKADSIFSKEITLIQNKLENLNTPKKLDIHNNVKEILSNDLKAILLKSTQEIGKTPNANQIETLKYIDKLSLQIDYYQLLSHLSNSTSLYLPFSWDKLEDGNIEMKKSDDGRFYCDIDLKLKEYGELNLKLTLYEKNQLNIHIYSSHDEFKKTMLENIPSLRSALIDIQITPREIRVFEQKEKKQNSPYESLEDELNIGFEVKA